MDRSHKNLDTLSNLPSPDPNQEFPAARPRNVSSRFFF